MSSDENNSYKKQNRTQKARILEIIEERPSMDVQINDEVFRFLRNNELDFLAEYFNGEYSKITL